MKRLIKMYSETEKFIICECCDGEGEDTKEWYHPLNDDNTLDSSHKYLDCCVKKVGEVLDWTTYEDFHKVISREHIPHIGKIPRIKGYKYDPDKK